MKKEEKEFKKYEKEIATLIAVQKEGKATVPQIVSKLKEWDLKVNETDCKEFAERLRRRDLLSIILERKNDISIQKYALNKIKNLPPVAHYKDIVDYEEGKELIKILDATKGVNKGRTPDIKDYFTARIKWVTTADVLGFIPLDGENVKCHYKDGQGKPIFKGVHFRKFLSANLRMFNIPESKGDYVGFSNGVVDLKGKPITKKATYVLANRTGSGESIWENLPVGTTIETTATVPGSEFTPEKFEKILKFISQNGLVGFGGWGKGNANNLEVQEFDFEGMVI
jgi:hypothetical protein|tara:strand:+ start:22726 stop:23574 length:849 start_codon:yes stop_codon:yes gene_type:complete